jgi:hypothetical protein
MWITMDLWWRIFTPGLWMRVGLYSSGLVVLLVYLSYRLVYSSSGQVETRLRQELESWIVAPLDLEGARHDWRQGTTLRRLDVSSPQGPQRQLLARLQHLKLGASWGDCPPEEGAQRAGPRGLRGPPRLSADDDAERRWLVCSARIRIDAVGEEIWSRAAWTRAAGSILAPGRLGALKSETPFDLFLESMELEVEGGGGDDARRLDLKIADLLVQKRAQGLRAECVLPECELWEEGALEASLDDRGVLRMAGRIENVVEADALLALATAPLRQSWLALRPQGLCDIELRRLEVDLEAAQPAVLDIVVVHHDSRFRFGGVEAAHGHGPMRLEAEALAFGGEGGIEPLRVEVLGLPCRVEGRLSGALGEVHLQHEEASLASVGTRGAAGLVSVLVDELRPSASVVRGEGQVRFGRGGPSWSWTLKLGSVSVAAMGAVRFHDGLDLRIERGPAPREGAPSATGEGRGRGEVVLGGVECVGIGLLRGSADLVWDDQVLEITGRDLRVSAASPHADSLPAASGSAELKGASSRGYEGKVDASLRFFWRDRRLEGSLDWQGVAVASALISAERVKGRWTFGQRESGHKEIADGSGAPSGGGGGECELEAVRVPAGILAEEEAVFESGKALLRGGDGGVEVVGLLLEGRDDALRVRGTLRWEGGIDVVVVRVRGEMARALAALPLQSAPAEWRGAAGLEFTGFELRGTVSAASSRPLSPTDPVFDAGR